MTGAGDKQKAINRVAVAWYAEKESWYRYGESLSLEDLRQHQMCRKVYRFAASGLHASVKKMDQPRRKEGS